MSDTAAPISTCIERVRLFSTNSTMIGHLAGIWTWLMGSLSCSAFSTGSWLTPCACCKTICTLDGRLCWLLLWGYWLFTLWHVRAMCPFSPQFLHSDSRKRHSPGEWPLSLQQKQAFGDSKLPFDLPAPLAWSYSANLVIIATVQVFGTPVGSLKTSSNVNSSFKCETLLHEKTLLCQLALQPADESVPKSIIYEFPKFAEGPCLVELSYGSFKTSCNVKALANVRLSSVRRRFCTSSLCSLQTNLSRRVSSRESPNSQKDPALWSLATYSAIDSNGFWSLRWKWNRCLISSGFGSKCVFKAPKRSWRYFSCVFCGASRSLRRAYVMAPTTLRKVATCFPSAILFTWKRGLPTLGMLRRALGWPGTRAAAQNVTCWSRARRQLPPLMKAQTGLKCHEAKEEYPGPREGREAEEHLGWTENSLGQGTKALAIIS